MNKIIIEDEFIQAYNRKMNTI